MRAAFVLACLVAGVNASAQGTKAPVKPDSSKAPAAKAPAAKAPVQQSTKTDAKAPAPGTKAPAQAPAPAQAAPPIIMRETFAYAIESRRDPFLSLLNSDELRPTVGDLRLTGVLFDESGRNSIATMRDLTTDAMYRVRTGQILGRMRVALIKRTVVIFSIQEFGVNRQDSLVLGDTTKARGK